MRNAECGMRGMVQKQVTAQGWQGRCPKGDAPDPILPAFTEAGRVRKPRPEPASIRTSSPGTEQASGSEKLRFCAFRATTPAFAEGGRGHKTIALKSLYKTHPNLY